MRFFQFFLIKFKPLGLGWASPVQAQIAHNAHNVQKTDTNKLLEPQCLAVKNSLWIFPQDSIVSLSLPGAGGGQSFKLDSGTQSWLSSRQSDTRHEIFSLERSRIIYLRLLTTNQLEDRNFEVCTLCLQMLSFQ